MFILIRLDLDGDVDVAVVERGRILDLQQRAYLPIVHIILRHRI